MILCAMLLCSIAHSIICTRLFRGKLHSDWFNGIEILPGRWQHGEKVGYCYPSGLEKTLLCNIAALHTVSFVFLFFISVKHWSVQSVQPTNFAIYLWDFPLVSVHLDYIFTPLVAAFLHVHVFHMIFQFTHRTIISVCSRFVSQWSILILYFKLLQRLSRTLFT